MKFLTTILFISMLSACAFGPSLKQPATAIESDMLSYYWVLTKQSSALDNIVMDSNKMGCRVMVMQGSVRTSPTYADINVLIDSKGQFFYQGIKSNTPDVDTQMVTNFFTNGLYSVQYEAAMANAKEAPITTVMRVYFVKGHRMCRGA